MAVKKRTTTFSRLSRKQREAITSRIVRGVKALALASGGRYKVVNSSDTLLREGGSRETVGEDGILSPYQRARMLNMARNQARNSSTFNAILKQFELQAVGTVGGKATFVFDDGAKAERVKEAFAKWTRDADFFDGMSLNATLKVILNTYILGGDLVLLFDDGYIEDSGRVLVYEPDEIGDIPASALKKHYGEFAHQSQGRVYNANGRFIGVCVSRSQRGEEVFDPKRCYMLRRDPSVPSLESDWIMPRNVFRIAQGRGVSTLSSNLGTIIDLEDLCNFELQAAKKNSQTVAQVLQEKEETTELPSAFDGGTDFSSMTDEELNAAADIESSIATQVVTLDQIKGAGAIYEVMPEGKKLELLDTKHPNQNMPEFIRWLAGRSAAPYGLGSVYATLKADASYTAFRGEQVMSQPAFEDAQKFLEGICDWVLSRWSVWATRKGIISADDLPANFARSVSWQWPKMREVNQVDEQNAIALKLRNGTGNYMEIYGADWREKLLQNAEEIKFCRENGIPHPALTTVSGAMIDVENKGE